MFLLNHAADVNGTYLVDGSSVRTSTNKLTEVFGPPGMGDGYKVSAEWSFVNEETNEVFTLYDWKDTNLYDPDLPAPSAQDKVIREWHVGGRSSPAEFIEWLKGRLAAGKCDEICGTTDCKGGCQ